MTIKDKFWFSLFTLISLIVPLLVVYLIYLPNRVNLIGESLRLLPLFHASLNGITSILIIIGYLFAKKKNRKIHSIIMLTAFICSIIFLVSYIISKIGNEPVPYGGDGYMRIVYFTILITHIVLAPIVIPLALFSIYWAFTKRIERHKRWTKFTTPLWLYVSVTGVLVYIFMFPYY